MKLSEMKTNQQLLAEDLARDPEFRERWERTALARAVAIELVRYRADHDLTQRQLAERAGMRQPQIARLELGEHNPSMDTLMRLSARLGLEFNIQVRPVTKTARSVSSESSELQDGSEVLVTAVAA